jgi:hypothetical protein
VIEFLAFFAHRLLKFLSDSILFLCLHFAVFISASGCRFYCRFWLPFCAAKLQDDSLNGEFPN